MRYRLLKVLGCGVLLLAPRAAAAQDTPRFGIVMGFPAAVGVLWNVSERVALRPTIDVSRNSSESTTTSSITSVSPAFPAITTTTQTTNTGWSLGVGVAALVYLSKGDALRTYIAPGFQYSRGSATTDERFSVSTGSPTQAPTGPETSTSSNYTTSGVFGAQYTLAGRFGFFGEIGVNYVHSGEAASVLLFPITQRDASSWSAGLRSSVGVVLFF